MASHRNKHRARHPVVVAYLVKCQRNLVGVKKVVRKYPAHQGLFALRLNFCRHFRYILHLIAIYIFPCSPASPQMTSTSSAGIGYYNPLAAQYDPELEAMYDNPPVPPKKPPSLSESETTPPQRTLSNSSSGE